MVPGLTKTLNKAGSVWVEGERIEYFSLTQTDNQYIFAQLRRATHGTSRCNHPIGATVYNGDLLCPPIN